MQLANLRLIVLISITMRPHYLNVSEFQSNTFEWTTWCFCLLTSPSSISVLAIPIIANSRFLVVAWTVSCSARPCSPFHSGSTAYWALWPTRPSSPVTSGEWSTSLFIAELLFRAGSETSTSETWPAATSESLSTNSTAIGPLIPQRPHTIILAVHHIARSSFVSRSVTWFLKKSVYHSKSTGFLTLLQVLCLTRVPGPQEVEQVLQVPQVPQTPIALHGPLSHDRTSMFFSAIKQIHMRNVK